MRELRAARAAAHLLGAALCLAAAQAAAYAQRSARPTPVERRLEHLNRQAVEHGREEPGRNDKSGAGKPSERRRTHEAAAEQVKKDFEDLQAGYNRIVIAMESKKGLDSASVMASVEEIHRCATRLRSSLALPSPEGDEKGAERAPAADAQMEESLMALRRHVYDFVTNPLFESPAGLDVEQAARAARDLDRVIEISGAVRKGRGPKKH